MKLFFKILIVTAITGSYNLKGFSQDSAITANIRTAFEMSYIYEKLENYTTAISKMKSVYDKNSYEINLRLAYLNYENALYSESAKYYQKAVALKPASIEARLGYALPLAAMESWDTLKIQYEEILSIDSNHSTANYRLGLIYYYKKEYETALTYFTRAAKSYPFDYSLTLMNAWTNLRLNNYADAKNLFNTVLLIQPGDTSSLRGLKIIKE